MFAVQPGKYGAPGEGSVAPERAPWGGQADG
jgi:hypothetical protein